MRLRPWFPETSKKGVAGKCPFEEDETLAYAGTSYRDAKGLGAVTMSISIASMKTITTDCKGPHKGRFSSSS